MKETVEDGPFKVDREAAPPWMIRSWERIIRDFAPSVHGAATAKASGRYSGILNSVVTLAYGEPDLLRTPTYITTDAQHRLIVSDPAERSVHVLDPAGKHSFRILGGEQYRLKAPAGVAADNDGNIYIADSEGGDVLVYDNLGRFERYIGLYHGERGFEHPTAIALDGKGRLLYVADTPSNLVLVFDLQGHPMKQLGGLHNQASPVRLEHPTSIAADESGVAILDSGSRELHILSRDGDPVVTLHIGEYMESGDTWNGVALDHDGNLYATVVNGASVMILTRNGQYLSMFGHAGRDRGQFQGPRGVWVDDEGRLYVADSQNNRVQVFEVGNGQSEGEAVPAAGAMRTAGQ